MRLLLVEDDERVMAALTASLQRHGFEVVRSRTGFGALEMLSLGPQVVLLDLGLPDCDGFEVCARIRRVSTVPIIVTTARGDAEARIRGLNLGADDYVVKPYNLQELIARIRAVSRRSTLTQAVNAANAAQAAGAGKEGGGPGDEPAGTGAAPLRIGAVHIDLRQRTIEVHGQPVSLTRKEFDLLALLARQPGEVLHHEQIIDELWHSTSAYTRRTLHVHVASLRQKLVSPGLIESVYGVGYRLAGAFSDLRRP